MFLPPPGQAQGGTDAFTQHNCSGKVDPCSWCHVPQAHCRCSLHYACHRSGGVGMWHGAGEACQGREHGVMSLSLSAGPSLLPWHVQMFIIVITILLLLIKRHPLAQPSHIPNLKQVSVFCRTDAILDPVLYCVALMSLEKASCKNTDLWNEILFLF